MQVTTVTTPDDLSSTGTRMVLSCLEKFEKSLYFRPDDENYYILLIDGNYHSDVLRKVEKIYENAGWKRAKCEIAKPSAILSSGITSLELWRHINESEQNQQQ